MIRWLVLFGYLSAAAWEDRRCQRIPNRLLVQLLAAGWPVRLWDCLRTGSLQPALEACSGFLAGAGLLLLVRLAFRRGVGAGDVKLLAVIGFYVGAGRVAAAAAVSCGLAAGACLFLLLFKKKGLQDGIALAPFLLAGTLVTVMAG